MFRVETRSLPYSECVSIASAFEPSHHHNELTSKNTDVIFLVLFDKKAISFWTHKKKLDYFVHQNRVSFYYPRQIVDETIDDKKEYFVSKRNKKTCIQQGKHHRRNPRKY